MPVVEFFAAPAHKDKITIDQKQLMYMKRESFNTQMTGSQVRNGTKMAFCPWERPLPGDALAAETLHVSKEKQIAWPNNDAAFDLERYLHYNSCSPGFCWSRNSHMPCLYG